MGFANETDGSGDERSAPLRPGAITALIAEMLRALPAEPLPTLNPGSTVGRYEVTRAIGRGGFGTVYEARDGVLNRLVALKVFHRTQATGAHVGWEGEAAARLAHPNIATLHDAGIHGGQAPYLVYELLRGETLASRLDRGPLGAREALGVAAQVCRALVHAHAAGVVHRDLKPANVFLSTDGAVKVLDFGVALLFGRDGPSGGTPAYMAPEQRHGHPEDARTDLYSLGLVLSEMLTGERDCAIDAASARVPLPARRILSSLLAEDPAARPESARAALAELESASRALAAPRVRVQRITIILAVAIALAAALAVPLLRQQRAQSGTMTDASSSPSIAVLPFADLSAGKDQEYFAEGLSEEILNALAHVEGLRVAGRASAFSFKGRNIPTAQIGRELHVGALLEGSVRREGQRVRITAEVVNAADGYRLWSESFDRELTGIFEVQDEIARAVVQALSVKLLPGHGPRMTQLRTTTPEAYRHYLLGRHFFNVGTTEGFGRAVEELEKAVALDERYAPAYAWLSTALLNSTLSRTAAGVSEPMQHALAAGERAVALGPELAECYSARGWMRTSISWDWAGAQADFERALALNPADTSALVRRGALFAVLGQLPEAIAITRRATEVDPLYAFGWVFLAGYYNAMGRPDLARDAVTRALEIAPQHSYALRELGYTRILAGEPEQALAIFQRHPWAAVRLAGAAIAHHDLGNLAEEQRALDELRTRFGNGEAYQVALVHAWRGDREGAFEWLERAYAQHNARLRYVKFDPMLRKIRDDPRYTSLLRKMNLPVE